ncbi:SusC/RagA family TonB-linked outer membrane protein [Bacteroides sedimenti]|uniref:SusC/RagA family TonB-linked outer membrane protein n=2 Tax=Bacteroides sedimenti TaxID=2136147 RepID=A0ABM8IB12_9BACE
MCFFSITVYAQNLRENNITLEAKNESVESVLKKLTKATNFKFFYDQKIVDEAPDLTLNFKNVSLQVILDEIGRQAHLSFNRTNNTIAVSAGNVRRGNVTPERTKNISGIVVDQNGEPIIGANVALKGTTNGTITDVDGKFSLNSIPEKSTLTVTYIGFKSLSISATDKNVHKITMVEDSKVIDEVVVVGYGVQKKRDVTTAIASIRSSDMKGQPVTSMAEAMVGRMPGVQVTQATGAPGSSLEIKVRGTGTITAGTSPLYVVDGVPLAKEQLNTFNMNDVESIEVLKDASSAAIYGSRGSNGVVLITTKKGSEGKASVAYNGYYGWQSVSKKIDMLNAYEYSDLVKDARNNTYIDKMESINRKLISQGKQPLVYSINDDNGLRLKNTSKDSNTIIPLEIMPYLNGEQGLTDTDWQDEIFRTAGMQNHSLSVSGGSSKVKYYASLDYLQQDGVIINSDYQRYSARLNLDVTEGIFKFGISMNPSHTKENQVNSDGAYNSNGGGIIASALHSSPIFPVYNPDGSYCFTQNSWSGDTKTTLPDGSVVKGNSQTQVWNPVALAMLVTDVTSATRIFGNVYGEAALLPELKYKANLGIDIYSDSRNQFRPSTLPISNTAGNPESIPEGESNTSSVHNWLFEQTLNFNKEFNGHSISALAGWTMQHQKNESNYLFANGFITNSIHSLVAGTVTRGNSKASEWSLLSGLARAQYSYLGKYMASGAIRADGASRFGKDNRWGYFPSLSLGWRLSEENFMKSLKFIDDLKIRASYGLTGNFRIPNYGALGQISYYSYVLGGTAPAVIKGAAPSSMPNPELKWEKTSQFNVGFDASMFKNRLTFGLDLYNSNTYDLLLDVPVPMTTGYNTRLENIGKVNNKGVEFNIATNQTMGDVKWSLNFNISKNINEVKELGPGNADIISSGSVSNAYFITRVGEPIGSYYLPVVEGVFKNQAEVDASLHYVDSPSNYGLADSKPGDFKFKDVNGDNILDISDTDRAIVGNYMPDFTYGFGGSFMWKGLDLNIVCQGVQGNEILNLSRRYFYNGEGNMNNYKGVLNRWKSESEPGSGMNVRANRVSKGQNGITSTWHIEDGSYLRVKNITLGYTLPVSLIKKAFISNARVYLSLQNPFTFTNYEGYNPEVSNRSDVTTNGEDYGVYPLARTTSLGINLTF